MAARTLKSRADRMITLFILGFMSCSARVPIYVLFAGAFFGVENAGNILFLIYISGAVLGLIAAKILRVFVFRGEDDPFVMEMPRYRLPSFKLIYHVVYGQARSYLAKAGTFILLASVLIWLAGNYPGQKKLKQVYTQKIESAVSESRKAELKNEMQARLLENSYLGMAGKVSEPFFSPLGFDWKMSVALETGLAAKELVVSTLGVLYSLGSAADEKSGSLQQKIREQIPLPAAVAFVVFVMIYIPCFAAVAVFVREAGGWRYLLYLFVMTTASAWVLSFLTYNVTGFFVQG